MKLKIKKAAIIVKASKKQKQGRRPVVSVKHLKGLPEVYIPRTSAAKSVRMWEEFSDRCRRIDKELKRIMAMPKNQVKWTVVPDSSGRKKKKKRDE